MAKTPRARAKKKPVVSTRIALKRAEAAELSRFLRLCRKIDALARQVKRAVPRVGTNMRELGIWLQGRGDDITTAADQRS